MAAATAYTLLSTQSRPAASALWPDFGAGQERSTAPPGDPGGQPVIIKMTPRIMSTARWTLQQAIGPDKLVVGLDADGVTDPDGNRLDGDLRFGLNVLPGDVNRSAGVIGNDLILVRNALGTGLGDPGYTHFADLDANGLIIGNDLIQVRNRLSTSLPPGEPDVPTAGSKGGPLAARAVDRALEEFALAWTEQEDSPKSSDRPERLAEDRMALLAEQLVLLGEDIEGSRRGRFVDRVLCESRTERDQLELHQFRIMAKGRR